MSWATCRVRRPFGQMAAWLTCAVGCAQPAPSTPSPTASGPAAQAATTASAPAAATTPPAQAASSPIAPAAPAEPALTFPTTPPLPLAQTVAPACTPGKAAPSSLSDAQLFGEIKACRNQYPPGRGVPLLGEAQRRLRGRPPRRDDIIDKMGFPTAGEHLSEINTWTRGAFTEKTADSVLVWQTYQSPMYWEFWFAVKGDRVVASGNWQAPRD